MFQLAIITFLAVLVHSISFHASTLTLVHSNSFHSSTLRTSHPRTTFPQKNRLDLPAARLYAGTEKDHATAVPIKSYDTTNLTCSSKEIAVSSSSFAGRAQVIFYFFVWYLGNVYYNVFNKRACMALGKTNGHTNAHWTLAAAQVRIWNLLL
jgi:hypothetical protein